MAPTPYNAMTDDQKLAHRDSVYKWRDSNRERFNRKRAEWARRLRLEVIDAYGGKCACCGEAEEVFLTLEHKNGVPDHHRGKNGKRLSSVEILRRVKMEGFPDAYEVLCWNCNQARARRGVCPHEAAKLRIVNG